MIAPTADLLGALRDVAHHDVDFFPGWIGGHPQGFGWHGGGEVPPQEQMALAELVVVHLVDTIPANVCGEVGCVVVLTPLGLQVLSVWESGEDGGL